MRLILATIDNSSDTKLVSYINMFVCATPYSVCINTGRGTHTYRLLLDINSFLLDIKKNRNVDTWDLPHVNLYDLDTLVLHGRITLRNVNNKKFKKRSVSIFDINNTKNKYIVSLIRNDSIEKLLYE